MIAVRVVLLCLAAAMICSAIRLHRPEVAAAISLAVGVAAILITREAFGEIFRGIERFVQLSDSEKGISSIVFKAAGITILAELGVQICCDAGESALAGRIRLAVRVVLLGMAMPLMLQIMDSFETLFAWCSF